MGDVEALRPAEPDCKVFLLTFLPLFSCLYSSSSLKVVVSSSRLESSLGETAKSSSDSSGSPPRQRVVVVCFLVFFSLAGRLSREALASRLRLVYASSRHWREEAAVGSCSRSTAIHSSCESTAWSCSSTFLSILLQKVRYPSIQVVRSAIFPRRLARVSAMVISGGSKGRPKTLRTQSVLDDNSLSLAASSRVQESFPALQTVTGQLSL